MHNNSYFGFGIETEHCLVKSDSFVPLFFEDLDFERLLSLVEEIGVSDFTSDGFKIKPLHRMAIPYLIEGYYLTDAAFKPIEMLPKGLEIRTPISDTIDGAVEQLVILTERLSRKVASQGMFLCSISHHPTRSDFHAPRNHKRDDYWQWDMTAMTTFGPDINISLPDSLRDEVYLEQLNDKINYYMPAVVALSFSSPLEKGGLWEIEGRVGKSVRTFKRSVYAPLLYIHKKQDRRFEFKGFEMATDINDYKAFFLFGLSMLLDRTLTEREPDHMRVERLRALAVNGLSDNENRERAGQVLASAEKIARLFNFDAGALSTLWSRLENGWTPADKIIEQFKNCGTVEDTMRTLVVKPHAAGDHAPSPVDRFTGVAK